jgi:hypothetical protein
LKPLVGGIEISTGADINTSVIALDSADNIYVAGYYSGNPVLYNLTSNPNTSGGSYSLPNTANQAAFLIKYNSSGVYQYSTTFSAGNLNDITGIAFDSAGGVYVAGYYRGNPTIYNMTASPNTSSSGYSLPDTTGGYQWGFLMNFSSTGSYVKSTYMSSPGYLSTSKDVVIDSSGNIYWFGTYGYSPSIYNMSANPGASTTGYSMYNVGSNLSAFLMKFDVNGIYSSSTLFYKANPYAGIARDSTNSIYVSGYTNTGYGTLYNMTANPGTSVSGYSLGGSSSDCAFIAKYNSSGNYVNAVMLGITNGCYPQSIKCDSYDSVYICGFYYGTETIYNFASNPQTYPSSGYSLPTPIGGSNAFLVKWSSGNYVSSVTINRASEGKKLTCDGNGNIYFTGYYGVDTPWNIYNLTASPNTISSGYSLPFVNGGGGSAYIIKWNSSGIYQSSTVIRPTSQGNACGTNSSGDKLFFGGRYSGAATATIYLVTANPKTVSSGYNLPASSQGFTIGYVPSAATSMTLANLGAGVTTVVEKPIYNLSGAAVTVTENSNTWTIPGTSNVATAMWTIDRWLIISYTPPVAPALYTFTTATFTSGGATGQNGPIISQARSGLTGTPAPSDWYNTYLTMTTQGIMLWTVPTTGSYTIEVWGARGGNEAGGNYQGGYGARMKGTFTLTASDVLKIMIGQPGGQSYGGGGGMTAVATNANVPLIVAGGGNTLSPWSSSPVNATTSTSGVNGSYGGAGSGGNGGSSTNGAMGGAGFYGNPTGDFCNNVPSYASAATRPQSFTNGGIGGTNGCNNSIGGFGGGSATDGCCYGASGAGGGYSGGAGTSSSSQYGGAGGSYNSGTNQSNDNGGTGTATRAWGGQCIITKL